MASVGCTDVGPAVLYAQKNTTKKPIGILLPINVINSDSDSSAATTTNEYLSSTSSLDEP